MLAIFELDSTLVDADSVTLWVRFLHQQLGLPQWSDELECNRLMHAFKHGMLTWGKYQQLAIEPLRGLTPAEGLALADRFIDSCLTPLLRPQAVELLGQHCRQGDTLVLLSASVEPWVSQLARRLRIDISLAIELEVSQERYTGRPLHRDEQQQQPLYWLRSRFADASQSCTAYGYSGFHTDLPVLEWVAHPRVTNPNIYLRNIARRRGWPILSI